MKTLMAVCLLVSCSAFAQPRSKPEPTPWARPTPTPKPRPRSYNPAVIRKAQEEAAKKQESEPMIHYSGNRETKIFHRPSCQHFDCENCTKGFNTRQAALLEGYSPCEVCNP